MPRSELDAHQDRLQTALEVSGDGWLTYFYRPESFAKSWAKIRDFAREGGKDPDKLLNAAQKSVAVGGTSGKSTVTGMIGWILHALHRQPTVMNGAVMKNFASPSAPFAGR